VCSPFELQKLDAEAAASPSDQFLRTIPLALKRKSNAGGNRSSRRWRANNFDDCLNKFEGVPVKGLQLRGIYDV
jgi:hypothetical protein